MKCAEANKVNLVEYLSSLRFTPAKIKGNNYWYLSPLRDEREASFKIDRNKNLWYDQGAGKGGSVVDFVTSYFNSDVSSALLKLSLYLQVSQKTFASTHTAASIILPEVQAYHHMALYHKIHYLQ